MSDELYYRIAELERMLRNMVRFVEVDEVDAAKGTAKATDRGGGEGKDLPLPQLPWAETGAPRSGGNGTTWRPPAKGQRMMCVSPSGRLSDGMLFPASFSDAAGQPSDKGDEHVETIGNARITYRNNSVLLECGGSKIHMTPDGITLTAVKIVTDGETHLGGDGGKLLHRKGDTDSAGHAAVGSASKVYAV
jgi:phage baseplate assembly protein gpV